MEKVNKQETFEEKLQKKHKKLLLSSVIRIVIVCIMFLSVFVYFISPVSKASSLDISGNIHLKNNDVLKIMNVNKDTSLFFVNEKKSKDLLDEHPLIRESNFEITPFSFKVEFKERAPSARYEDKTYTTVGDYFSKDEMESTLIKDYLDTHLEKISLINSNPLVWNNDRLNDILYITSLVNIDSKLIDYIDVEGDDYVFYYKLIQENGNLNYLRVKLKYDLKFSLENYISCLDYSIINDLYNVVDASSRDVYPLYTKKMIDNVELNCYSLIVELSRNIDGRIERIIKNDVI